MSYEKIRVYAQELTAEARDMRSRANELNTRAEEIMRIASDLHQRFGKLPVEDFARGLLPRLADRKIEAIKEIRCEYGLTLKDAKDIADKVFAEFQP